MVNLLNPDSEPPKRSSVAKQRMNVTQLCSDLLEYIETKHLDLSDDERMRLDDVRHMSD